MVLDERDDPIRVDVALRETQPAQRDTLFLETVSTEIYKATKTVAGLYGGQKHYNALLLEADKRVRTTHETMEMYHKLIMQELKTPLIHSRSQRRFYYP